MCGLCTHLFFSSALEKTEECLGELTPTWTFSQVSYTRAFQSLLSFCINRLKRTNIIHLERNYRSTQEIISSEYNKEDTSILKLYDLVLIITICCCLCKGKRNILWSKNKSHSHWKRDTIIKANQFDITRNKKNLDIILKDAKTCSVIDGLWDSNICKVGKFYSKRKVNRINPSLLPAPQIPSFKHTVQETRILLKYHCNFLFSYQRYFVIPTSWRILGYTI